MEDNDLGLSEGEEILWKHVEQKNLTQEATLKIAIGIILIATLSLGGNVIFYFIFSGAIEVFIPLFIFPIGVLLIIGYLLIYPGIIRYLEIRRNLARGYRELRFYLEKTVVTTKNLVKKSYDAFSIDYSENPISDLEGFQLHQDLVHVKLTSIEVVHAEPASQEYHVGFKFNKSDKSFVPLLFTIPIEKYAEFIDVLEEYLPLKRKKLSINGTIIYYKNNW